MEKKVVVPQTPISLLKAHKNWREQLGFTIIELFVVFLLISITLGIIVVRTGTYSFWRQESFVRQLSDTLIFLHHEAISDQAFYRIEFDLEKQTYTIGVVRPDYDFTDPGAIDFDAGVLTLELASIISPSVSDSSTLIPPPSFPSLAIPVEFPPELQLQDVRTVRGKQSEADGEKPFIFFSPRGFSEFAVLHLKTGDDKDVTILVNPFSGNTTIYREYKDFEWSYGKTSKS